MKPIVTLTSSNMGNYDTEEAYDSYVNFVCNNIDEYCGFEVYVDVLRYGECGDTKIISQDYESKERIKNILQDLWCDWCALG